MSKFIIKKEKDDPICTRVSLGGNHKCGFYLVYRGDEEEVKELLEEANKHYRKVLKYKYSKNE